LRRINLESNTYVHGSKTRNLPIKLSLPQLAKPLVLPINVYTLSSIKLEIRQNSFCLEARGWGEREVAGGRKNPPKLKKK
jgi:hypothetical protein